MKRHAWLLAPLLTALILAYGISQLVRADSMTGGGSGTSIDAAACVTTTSNSLCARVDAISTTAPPGNIFAGIGYPGLGFGDGSDGTRTVSSSTTDAAGTILSQYTTLTIDASQVLTADSGNNYRIILASTSITVNGEINVDGLGASSGTTAATGTQGGDGGSVAGTAVAWTATGSGGGGGSGAAVTSGTSLTAGNGGGAGGTGGAGGAGVTGGADGLVGTAGTATSAIKAARAKLIFGPGGLSGGPAIHPSLWTLLNSFGGGGGGGSTGVNAGANDGAGGAGGKGGGCLLLAAPTITIGSAGILSSNGAVGSNGTNATAGGGGGGGGGGGCVISIARTLSNSGTIRANGGAAGTGGTGTRPGGAGAAGATGLTLHIPVR